MLTLSEFLFLSLLLIVFFSGLFFYTRNRVGKGSFLTLTLIPLVSYATDLLYKYSDFNRANFFLVILYLGSTLAATSLFFLLSQFTLHSRLIKFPYNLLLLIEPAISIVIILSLPAKTSLLEYTTNLPLSEFWAWEYFHKLYIIGILLLTITLVAPYISFGTKLLRNAAHFIFIAAFLPIAPMFLGENAVQVIFHAQMFSFTLSSIFLGLFLFKTSTEKLPLLTRDHAVESMQEGWILLDAKNRIVDVNPSAEEILYTSKANIYGADAKVIFARWPNIAKSLETQQEFDAKGSLSIKEGIRHLHIRILQVRNSQDVFVGRLILLRDNTERRQAEAARQEARDEMFSLLHSISGAASRSENTDEFILAALYQLGYSFESKAIAVFLVDEELHKNKHHLLLVAHQGIASENIKKIAFLDEKYEIVSEIAKSREAILIEDTKSDSRVPDFLRDTLEGCLLLIPIIDEDEFVGLLLMTRENNTYSDDEIVRLEIVSRQVGSFVQNDRRRHIASTLAERQRLIRDLHDSVTQRLYGLVMMTESARLGFSAGTIDEPEELVAQLGFSARQALKEMRLFLYKLQPVDIERAGFISALLHRLEAVEGRAGLEVKLDIDQNLVLSMEEDVHLFLIAQEVLNNIIKHANASTVKISFRKARIHIHLKISDDGSGFNIQEANRSGLGMMNIRERAKIIGANVKINSIPGQGTTVAILIRQGTVQKTKSAGTIK